MSASSKPKDISLSFLLTTQVNNLVECGCKGKRSVIKMLPQKIYRNMDELRLWLVG